MDEGVRSPAWLKRLNLFNLTNCIFLRLQFFNVISLRFGVCARAAMKRLLEADLKNYSALHLTAVARELRILESEADLVACAAELSDGRAVMLGGGSNVVFAERVERTLLRLGEAFQALEFFDLPPEWAQGGAGLPGACCVVRVGAAVPLAKVVAEAASRNLGGIEMLAGIPGTLGGAVFMNAGANGGCISDVLLRARVFDARRGAGSDLSTQELDFSYRHSLLQDNPHLAVTGVELQLFPAAGRDIAAEVAGYVKKRSSSQVRHPNCGSVFKNPPGEQSAGKLIEAAGLKGERQGALQVSHEHANYFENHGGATATDFCALRDRVVERVCAAYGIALECEVRFIR